MATFATIKNWQDFQHYKDRNPPWIKLHKSFLDDFDFACLPLASKALAPLLWLIASESKDGQVQIDDDFIAFRLRWPIEDVRAGVTPLIEKGFLVIASDPLAARVQVAVPETEAERETEGETPRKRVAADRGTRLPPDWQPSEHEKQWAERERPEIDIGLEAAKFRDYWHGVAGSKGVKLDWPGTWRNWIRRADAPKRSGFAPPPVGTPRQRRELGT